MENAALLAALHIERRLTAGAEALILCGGGNNGGDGLAVARQLLVRGHSVRVELWADPKRLSPDCAVQWGACEALGIPRAVHPPGQPWFCPSSFPELLVDGLLGTGATGELRPWMASRLQGLIQAVDALDASDRPSIVALDLPTGVDADTGRHTGPVLPTDCTLTFAAQKSAMNLAGCATVFGEVHVLPIGIPLDW